MVFLFLPVIVIIFIPEIIPSFFVKEENKNISIARALAVFTVYLSSYLQPSLLYMALLYLCSLTILIHFPIISWIGSEGEK